MKIWRCSVEYYAGKEFLTIYMEERTPALTPWPLWDDVILEYGNEVTSSAASGEIGNVHKM